MEENNLEQKNKLSGIHTFQSDMAGLVREENSSVIDIALAQNKKREADSTIPEIKKENKFKDIFFLGIGILIIIFAILGGIFLIKKGEDNSIAKNEEIKVQTFISYEDQTQLDLSNSIDKREVAKRMKTEVDKILNPGKIKLVLFPPTLEKTTIGEFAQLAKINIPKNVITSLDDQFMVGIFSPYSNSQVELNNRQNNLFVVLKIKNYEQALSQISLWEKTMLNDLFIFFNIDVSGENQSLLSKTFEDKIISNRDTRVIKNDKGTDILYYMFLDTNYVIISDNKNALQEIVSRIIVKNIKPL